MARPEIGQEVLLKFADGLKDYAVIETEPKVEEPDNKKSIVVPEPVSSTAEVKEEVAQAQEESENAEETEEIQVINTDNEEETQENVAYLEETRFEVKPSLWQRIKNSKLFRTISYILRIRVVLDYPALPEGNLDK